VHPFFCTGVPVAQAERGRLQEREKKIERGIAFPTCICR